MTDYNAILAAETDPEAPLRSSLFKRIVANPLAIAEGAAGAPRVQGRGYQALIYEGLLQTMPETIVTINDLDPSLILDIYVWIGVVSGTTGFSTASIRFSSNNGSSFGAWAQIAQANSSDTGGAGDDKKNISLRLNDGINLNTYGLAGVPEVMTVNTPTNAIGFRMYRPIGNISTKMTVIVLARGRGT